MTALGFLTVVADGAPLASSPVEAALKAAGAQLEAREGWRVAMRFGDVDEELSACRTGVAIADRSALAKFEVQRGDVPDVDALVVARTSPERALVVGAAVDGALDVTAGYAAFELRGPRTRALLERLTALDVRADRLAVGDVCAGVVARVPALLARTGDDVYLLLVGADLAPDVLEIAVDAGAVLVGEEARASA
jgi:glycine cleavage system aminomethyltransferase T